MKIGVGIEIEINLAENMKQSLLYSKNEEKNIYIQFIYSYK